MVRRHVALAIAVVSLIATACGARRYTPALASPHAATIVAGSSSPMAPTPNPIATGSAAAAPLDLPAVIAALSSAGIAIVNVASINPPDEPWKCLPHTFRLARVAQQPPAGLYRPGDRPSVAIFVFPSAAERSAAQALITADGQVDTPGCATSVDWVASTHLVSVRNVLLFIVTDDPAELGAVQAAANGLAASP